MYKMIKVHLNVSVFSKHLTYLIQKNKTATIFKIESNIFTSVKRFILAVWFCYSLDREFKSDVISSKQSQLQIFFSKQDWLSENLLKNLFTA